MGEDVTFLEKGKLLFAFYVFGDEYYEYIPLCLYFIGKSHPEAQTVICCKERLPDSVNLQLRQLSNQRYRIEELVFNDCISDVNICKSYRWIMRPKEYENHDYVYIGDIDLFITDDALLSDHLRICEEHNLPYSNTDKIDVPPGIRFTGLHFFKSKEYLSMMSGMMSLMTSLIRGAIPDWFYNKHQGRYDNQKILRDMIKLSGLPMPTHKFFKYHGLHLGHSRCEGRWQMFFSNPADEHVRYYHQYQEFLDDEYWTLYNAVSDKIRFEIDEMTNGFQQVYRDIL